MKNILLIVLGIVVLIVGGFFVLNNYIYQEKQAYTAADYKNAEYAIEGTKVRLINGKAEIEVAPGSATRTVTQYFGNEARADLNGDGKEDVVFLLTQNAGGSGTFYYVVAALQTESGYQGSDAVLLGDRIAPQTTEIKENNIIVVNYADRAAGEPMTAQPSVGKSIWLKLDPSTLTFGEVAQNFEGEADSTRMTLDMKAWSWVSASKDGKAIVLKQPSKFALTFGTDGKFSAKTDCNQMGGSYVTKGEMLTFSNIFSTKMFCEGSQENEFADLLTNTTSYHFTSKGELILGLKSDSGTVTFR